MAKKRITKKTENWMKSYWRPIMCWQYAFVCMYDFFFAPVIYNILSVNDPTNIVQWNPITLQAGGFYHLAMGAIIGVYAWSRGIEKHGMINKNIIPVGYGEDLYESAWYDNDQDRYGGGSGNPYFKPPGVVQNPPVQPDDPFGAPTPSGKRGVTRKSDTVPEEVDDPDLFL